MPHHMGDVNWYANWYYREIFPTMSRVVKPLVVPPMAHHHQMDNVSVCVSPEEGCSHVSSFND